MVVERDLVSAFELVGVGAGVAVGTGAGAGMEFGGACTGLMARGQELEFCGSFLWSKKLGGGRKCIRFSRQFYSVRCASQVQMF